MQYQVPQFIDIEDKIFGPLTLKQFIYLAGGGGLCLLFFTALPLYLAIPLSLPFIGLSVALAFYKVNDQAFIITLEHAFTYQLGSKLYIWKQREVHSKQPIDSFLETSPETVAIPKLSQSKLKDLSWALNIKDQVAMGISQDKSDNFTF